MAGQLTATIQRKDTSESAQIFDLGIISSVTVSYSANVNQSAILLWGYTGAFTMDMGVSKTISIAYTRVCPDNPTQGSDSTKWSNAYWKKRFKQELNGWQSKHEGYILKITSPDSDLFPSTENIGYIQSLSTPISSKDVNTIQGRLEFTVGRLTLK